MAVLKPWIPVVSKKNDTGYDVSVLNRTYKLTDTSPFFASVTSMGQELLSSPMRIIAQNKGVPCKFSTTKHMKMTTSNDERTNLIATMESDLVIINVSHGIEFDGCDEITLSVMPTGRSVAACFGLEPYDPTAFDVDKLWLEIPLKKDIFKYFTIPTAPHYNNPDEADEFAKNPLFNTSGVIPPSGIHAPFSPQIYLNGLDKGLGFFFGTDEYFENDDKARVFEVFDNGDELVLRIRFFDKTPESWLDKGKDNNMSRSMLPIIFKFGMQVTPVKTPEKRPYKENEFHIDCFTKIPREMHYDEFFSKPVIDGDTEIGFDRIKRLGVEVLYIHEKWNDIQNFFELTCETSERLKYIIKECHKRGIKVIPYFGYELSTLSSVYHESIRKYIMGSVVDGKKPDYMGTWYRYPYQRDMRVCYNNEYGEMFADGIIALQKEYGFDGFYFDATLQVHRCGNYEHGCGYFDKQGKLHPTSHQFELRKMAKKIYAHCSENDLIIQAHLGFYCLCDCGFYSHSLIGEDIQGALLRNEIDCVPEQLMMAKYTSRDIGVPTYTICYSNEDWPYESGNGVAMLYGTLGKPVDIKKPLEYMSKVWDIFRKFPMEESTFLPYYDGNNSVLSDNENVKVSIYEAQDKILAVCTSISNKFEGDVTISGKFDKVTDALKCAVISENGKCKLHFKGIECYLLIFEKN